MFKRLIIISLVLYSMSGICSLPALADTAKVKYLTKGEMIDLLSSADVVKQKINELVSWGVGYDVSAVNKMKMVPTFNYIAVVPKNVPPDGRTVLEIKASVDDPGGLPSIAGVRADLSPIGRMSNMSLVDNGLFGDTKQGDGVYTLQSSINPKVMEGGKVIPVTAVNKKGWMAMGSATLDVNKKPTITEINLKSADLSADGKSTLVVAVGVDNPGKINDVKFVLLDLSSVGIADKIPMKWVETKSGMSIRTGMFAVAVEIPAGSPRGKHKATIEVINSTGGYASSDFNFNIR